MAKDRPLPRFDLLSAAFPRGSVDDVGKLIGGKVRSNLEGPDEDYKNTCAIRVSRSLNYAADAVVRTPGVRANSGKDKRWYVYGVRDMKQYMVYRYGPPDVRVTGKQGSLNASSFAGHKGIIMFEFFHVDLWDNDHAVRDAYFDRVDAISLWTAA